MSTAALSLSDFISESDVYERYGGLFASHELKEARRSGELEYYQLRKGYFYTEKQLLAYIEKRRKTPCENRPLVPAEDKPPVSGNSKTNGSAPKKAPVSIIVAGTPEMDALAARALERTI